MAISRALPLSFVRIPGGRPEHNHARCCYQTRQPMENHEPVGHVNLHEVILPVPSLKPSGYANDHLCRSEPTPRDLNLTIESTMG